MGADQLQRRPAVEKAGADHFQNIDGAVEQITRDDRELIIARAILSQGVCRMYKQGHAEIDGSLNDGRKTGIVQIKATNVGSDMTTDETVLADTAAQLLGGGFRV